MPRCVGDEKDEICRAFGIAYRSVCYVRYRMNEAKIRYGINMCSTSTPYMCSVLSRYVICYLYQLIHVVLCFVLFAQLSRLCRFFDLFEFSYSWHCLFLIVFGL